MNPRSNMPQETTFRYHVSKCIAHFFGKVLQSSQYYIDTKIYYRYAALSLSIIYELYAFECIDLVPGNNKTMTLNKCFILSHFKMLTGNLNPFPKKMYCRG